MGNIIMAILKGVLLTLKVMGLKYTIREAIRRTLRMPYIYNGVAVKDAVTFRVLRGLAARGHMWTNGNEVFFRNEFGVFAVPVEDVNLLGVFGEGLLGVFPEGLKSMYGYLDVKGKVVADVGAYLGETAVMFARMGARWVHAYEPVYYKYAMRNLELNNITNATVHPYGVWTEEDMLNIALAGTASGLATGEFKIETKPVEDVIADVVKIDCEGCEWSLLTLTCPTIRKAEEYAIEIHGPAPPLVRKLEKCGYAAKEVASVTTLVTLWHFRRR